MTFGASYERNDGKQSGSGHDQRVNFEAEKIYLVPRHPIPERTAMSRTVPAVIRIMRGRMPLFYGTVNEGGTAEVNLSSFAKGGSFFYGLKRG